MEVVWVECCHHFFLLLSVHEHAFHSSVNKCSVLGVYGEMPLAEGHICSGQQADLSRPWHGDCWADINVKAAHMTHEIDTKSETHSHLRPKRWLLVFWLCKKTIWYNYNSAIFLMFNMRLILKHTVCTSDINMDISILGRVRRKEAFLRIDSDLKLMLIFVACYCL